LFDNKKILGIIKLVGGCMNKYVLKVINPYGGIESEIILYPELTSSKCQLASIDEQFTKFVDEEELKAYINNLGYRALPNDNLKLFYNKEELPIFYESDPLIKNLVKELTIKDKKPFTDRFIQKYLSLLFKEKKLVNHVGKNIGSKNVLDVLNMINISTVDNTYNSRGASTASYNFERIKHDYTIMRKLYVLLIQYNKENNTNLDVVKKIDEPKKNLFTVRVGFPQGIKLIRANNYIIPNRIDRVEGRSFFEQIPEEDIIEMLKDGRITRSLYEEYIEESKEKGSRSL
jgi:hypothetical protein